MKTKTNLKTDWKLKIGWKRWKTNCYWNCWNSKNWKTNCWIGSTGKTMTTDSICWKTNYCWNWKSWKNCLTDWTGTTAKMRTKHWNYWKTKNWTNYWKNWTKNFESSSSTGSKWKTCSNWKKNLTNC